MAPTVPSCASVAVRRIWSVASMSAAAAAFRIACGMGKFVGGRDETVYRTSVPAERFRNCVQKALYAVIIDFASLQRLERAAHRLHIHVRGVRIGRVPRRQKSRRALVAAVERFHQSYGIVQSARVVGIVAKSFDNGCNGRAQLGCTLKEFCTVGAPGINSPYRCRHGLAIPIGKCPEITHDGVVIASRPGIGLRDRRNLVLKPV